jgi:hypothetical protein
MKVNKALMDKARFERKAISELTVSEFRSLMQECFDADRSEVIRRNNEESERLNRIRLGIYENQNPVMQGFNINNLKTRQGGTR